MKFPHIWKSRDKLCLGLFRLLLTKYYRLGGVYIYIHKTNLFLSDLKSGKSKIKVLVDSCLLRILFLIHRLQSFLRNPLLVEERSDLFGIYFLGEGGITFIQILIPLMRILPFFITWLPPKDPMSKFHHIGSICFHLKRLFFFLIPRFCFIKYSNFMNCFPGLTVKIKQVTVLSN